MEPEPLPSQVFAAPTHSSRGRLCKPLSLLCLTFLPSPPQMSLRAGQTSPFTLPSSCTSAYAGAFSRPLLSNPISPGPAQPRKVHSDHFPFLLGLRVSLVSRRGQGLVPLPCFSFYSFYLFSSFKNAFSFKKNIDEIVGSSVCHPDGQKKSQISWGYEAAPLSMQR